MKQSFTEDVLMVMSFGVIRYKGCSIIPQNGNFICGENSFNSVQAAKDRIDEVCERILNSISIIPIK